MSKVFTLDEVSEHRTNKDCWLVIDGKVYDVTKFLEDHPGGDEVLLTSTGKDATDDFEDVGHSTSARTQMKEYYIGDFDTSTVVKKNTSTLTSESKSSQGNSSGFLIKILQFLVPLIILGVAVAVRFYSKSSV